MRTVLLSIIVLSPLAAAQDLQVKAAPQRRAVVLTNAMLHPVASEPRRGALWFDGGVIRGIDAVAPADLLDAEVIDLEGKHVYPGLISAVTTLGLVEIDSIAATRDHTETGGATPEVRAAVAVNPDSTVLPVTRSNGVLIAGVFPQGGRVPGRASVIGLEGWTWEDMTVLDDAGLVVDWPAVPSQGGRFRARRGSTPPVDVEVTRREVDDLFVAARAYVRAKDNDSNLRTDIRYEAMRAALRGERPVFLRAQELEQIQSGVAWAIDRGLRPVVVGGRDAAGCATMLARHDVPVIVTGTHYLPKRRDSDYDEPFTLPARLQAAGLRWCLASVGNFYNERNLPFEAATAVAHGLDAGAALRAITLSAAEILGVGARLGSLEVGKAATLFVSDGDPLEIRSRVQMAFIDGKLLDLANKQTALAAKYREKYRQLGLLPAAGK